MEEWGKIQFVLVSSRQDDIPVETRRSPWDGLPRTGPAFLPTREAAVAVAQRLTAARKAAGDQTPLTVVELLPGGGERVVWPTEAEAG